MNNDSPIQGLSQPHPLEATIKAQNAKRIQTRAAYAGLADSIAATDFDSMRRDAPRQIGGTFEKLQAIPKRIKNPNQNITDKDINSFLSAFNFSSLASVTPRRDSFRGRSTGSANNVGTQAFNAMGIRYGF